MRRDRKLLTLNLPSRMLSTTFQIIAHYSASYQFFTPLGEGSHV